MKTRQLLIAALITGASVLTAQNEAGKKATVHIKKVENINGVEKVTDTTYTTDDPASIKMEGGNMEIKETKDGKGTKKVVIMNVEENGDGTKMSDEELQTKMEAFTIDDPKQMEGKQVIVKKVGKCNATQTEIDSVKKEFHVTIIKRIEIKDANSEEMKRLGKPAGDNKLEMNNMSMNPNPSNGKFDLNFNLKNKGDAEITVFDMQGKQVYNEKLAGFQGEYKKSIDLSNNQKGIYFVKILQDKHTQVKKVVIE
jgi:hypothetical protein